MRRWKLSKKFGVTLFCIGLTAPLAMADDNERQSVTVAFGRGLNTAQQHNMVNHVILPNDIKIDQDGVVHFLVAGFHQPFIYNPGTSHQDIVDNLPPSTSTFINFTDNLFYQGISPAGASTNPLSNAQNRVESVGFPANVGTGTPPSPIAKPGVYLVICNVREHFAQGMFGFVEVEKQDD
jgi:hypothetical protein